MDSSSNAARSKFQEIIHTKFVSYFITVIFHTAVGDWLLFASVVATCPDLSGDIRIAGLCYIALKRYEEALDTFRFLMNISNSNQHVSNSLIWAYCSNGNFEEAKTLMNELETRSLTEYIAGTYRGISAAYLGNINAAFHYLEKAFKDRDPILLELKYSPAVPASLRNDPRFKNLLDRMGFSE